MLSKGHLDKHIVIKREKGEILPLREGEESNSERRRETVRTFFFFFSFF